MEKHSLLTDESIRAWIADHEPNGEQKLLDELVNGIGWRAPQARNVAMWFERKKATLAAEQAARDEALRQREVGAAEDAARSARIAARWAFISAIVALAALAVSAWPHTPWGRT